MSAVTIPSARRYLPSAGRRAGVIALVLTVLSLTATAAWAFWSTTGKGTGAATTGTLNPPTQVSAVSTTGSGNVDITWEAPTSGVEPNGYYVQRTSDSDTMYACDSAPASPIDLTSCTDEGVPDGTYAYVVVAVFNSWTATSDPSDEVNVVNAISTTTTLESAANPSVVGQTVTYVATVDAGTAAPIGSVTFMDGSEEINCTGGNQTLNGSGRAECLVAYAQTGVHSISATYNGSQGLASSTSEPISQSVDRAATTSELRSGGSPSEPGQQVVYRATVSVTSPGAGAPSGTVLFKDGPTPICSDVVVADGEATCSVSYSSPSDHSITAEYSGDDNFLPSISDSWDQGVSKLDTSTALSAMPNPATVGESVTLTAEVTESDAGATVAAGTVEFQDGEGTIGSCGAVPLDAAGVATCTTAFASASTRNLTAKYGGSADYNASSGDASLTVNPAATLSTTTEVRSSASKLTQLDTYVAKTGQTVTYTATVTSSKGTPTGTVTFKDGGTPITCTNGSQTLSNGQATCDVSYASAENHEITVVYGGSNGFTSSSAALAQLVRNASVIGVGVAEVKINGSPATPTCSWVSGSMSASCTITGTAKGSEFSFRPAFVTQFNPTVQVTAYGADDSSLSYSGSDSIVIPGGVGTSEEALSWTQSGNGKGTFTLLWRDDFGGTFTLTVTMQ